MDKIYPYISITIGILGILIALYQRSLRKRLSRYLRSQSWFIYSMSLISWSAAQKALKKYKEVAGENLNQDVFESLSKCDAFSLNISLESIRQIQLSESRFDLEAISAWVAQGKIPQDQVILFLRNISDEPPGMLSMLSLFWKTFTMKITMNLHKKATRQLPKADVLKKDGKIQNGQETQAPDLQDKGELE